MEIANPKAPLSTLMKWHYYKYFKNYTQKFRCVFITLSDIEQLGLLGYVISEVHDDT